MIWVVGAAIVRHGTCLVARRGPTQHDGGKWEFPGGKVEAGETGQEALVRELQEELRVTIEVGDHLGRGEAAHVVLDVYVATLVDGEPRAVEHDALRWLGPDELSSVDWADADLPLIEPLAAHLRKM